jgi:putative aminopeptidase FrvX
MRVFSTKVILFSLYFIFSVFKPVYADSTLDTLKQLCNIYGVSGFENDVREILSKYWTEQRIKYEIDGMGNLIGKFPSHSDEKPTLLIMAHMDEVGFMTSKIDDDGFISIIQLGGWMDHVIWSQKWVIRTPDGKYISAVSGMDAPHVLSDFTKTPSANKEALFLDTGLSKKELIDLGVRPGLPVTPLLQILNSNSYRIKDMLQKVLMTESDWP